MNDVEIDIYKFLDKLKKKGELDNFHQYANETIQMFINKMEERLEYDLDIDLLVQIMEENGLEYNFYLNLSEYEKELIGTMLFGLLDNEDDD